MPAHAPELSPDEIADRVRAQLGDAVDEIVTANGMVAARIKADRWLEAARFVKEDEVLRCTFFSWLSAIDWTEQVIADATLEAEASGDDEAGSETTDAAPEDGTPVESSDEPAPDESTGDVAPAAEVAPSHTQGEYSQPSGELFQVMAWMSAPERGFGILLKADLDKESATIESLTPVYAGADWHERECHEMFGIDFEGHPQPEHLYLPEDFEGHPLLKTFKLGAREVKPWPGIVDVEEIPEALEAILDARARGEGDA